MTAVARRRRLRQQRRRENAAMRDGRVTIEKLARDSGLDEEELLIRLWDLGYEDVEDPKQALAPSAVREVRRLLGLPTARELVRPRYWQAALGLDEEGLSKVLQASGVMMNPRAKTLPKGAIRVLKKAALSDHLLETPPVPATEVTALDVEEAPLLWERIGKLEAHRFLEPEEIKGINQALARDFASTDDPIGAGVRSADLLASAAFRQHTSSGEDRKYPTVSMVAAALFHSLVLNHAFDDGNKRTALVALLVVLDENGVMLTCDQESLFRLVVRLANHQLIAKHRTDQADREVKWIAEWIESNSRPVEKGERIVQWHKLKQILARFGATCSTARGRGNRMNIIRERPDSRRVLGIRARPLTVQVFYQDDGSDVSKSTLNAIRRALELDEEHGIDSASFYGDAGRSADEFIVSYRKVLRQLAKF